MMTHAMRIGSLISAAAVALCGCGASDGERDLRVYIVHHGRGAFDKLVPAFVRETGIGVHETYACRTELFDVVSRAGDADVCITSGVDNIERFEREGLSRARPVTIAELIPIIQVLKGNPKGIASVADLGRPGVRLALGADRGCLGLTATEVLAKAGLTDAVAPKVVKRVKGEHNVAACVDGTEVDATLVWASTTVEVAPDRYDMVAIPSDCNAIDPVAAIVLKDARNPDSAEKFVAFLQRDSTRQILRAAGLLRPTPNALAAGAN